MKTLATALSLIPGAAIAHSGPIPHDHGAELLTVAALIGISVVGIGVWKRFR
ncbi:MAG: hypothetical protein AAF479_09010 [Pseudomonadota bacterium]